MQPEGPEQERCLAEPFTSTHRGKDEARRRRGGTKRHQRRNRTLGASDAIATGGYHAERQGAITTRRSLGAGGFCCGRRSERGSEVSSLDAPACRGRYLIAPNAMSCRRAADMPAFSYQ